MVRNPDDPGGAGSGRAEPGVQSLEPELLAALLDGKLSEAERAEALELLSRSPGDFDVFAEAAGILADLDIDTDAAPAQPVAEPVASPSVVPIQRARRFPPAKVLLPLAAVLAGVLLIPALVRDRDPTPYGLLDGATLVGSPGSGSLAAALGEDWNDWGDNRTRGDGNSGSNPEQEFHAGVLLAQVEVAFDAGDTQVMQKQLTPGLVRHLGGTGVPGFITAQYEDIAERMDDPGGVPEHERAEAAANVSAFFEGAPWFELGMWVEQARLAALAGQTAFFDRRAARVLERLTREVAEQQDGDTQVTQSLRQLQDRMQDGVSPDELASIRSLLAAVIDEIS